MGVCLKNRFFWGCLTLLVSLYAGGGEKEDAKAKIAALVSKYEAGKDYYGSSRFLEKDTRKEFIDPFFAALGWDVGNDEGPVLWRCKKV